MKYLARLTKQGAERRGINQLAGEIIEYETIRPLGKCILNPYLNNEQLPGIKYGFTGEDRSVELITWPSDFNYKGE